MGNKQRLLTTFAPSGKFAYVAGMGNGELFIIRADDRQTIQVIDFGHAGTHQTKPSPDGSFLLIAQAHSSSLIKMAADEAAESWNVVGDPLPFAPQGKRPICTVIRDDGQRAYVSLLPDGLAIVDVPTMTVLKSLIQQDRCADGPSPLRNFTRRPERAIIDAGAGQMSP